MRNKYVRFAPLLLHRQERSRAARTPVEPKVSSGTSPAPLREVYSWRCSRSGAGPQSGQTLIVLLIFMMLVIILGTAAAMITIANLRSNSAMAGGQQALMNAESGAENALMRLLRDPSYSGESINLANRTGTITVNGTNMKTITSEGVAGSYHRTVTVTASYSNDQLTVTDWKEAQ